MKKTTDDSNENEEINNKYLRSLADYQNLEKQTQIWREEFVKFANQNLIVQLLEILDHLETAQANLQDDGLQLIVDKLKVILKNSGLEEIEVLGTEFNPVLEEAVEVIPGQENNKITEVKTKGYKLNGKVIRPAKVVVSKIE